MLYNLKKYLLALFRCQYLPHYVDDPDKEVLLQHVNVLVFFTFFHYFELLCLLVLCNADCSGEDKKQHFTFLSISFLIKQMARTVFIVKRLRQAPEKSGKLQWHRIIINFILFHIAMPTHKRSLHVSCGKLSMVVAPTISSISSNISSQISVLLLLWSISVLNFLFRLIILILLPESWLDHQDLYHRMR